MAPSPEKRWRRAATVLVPLLLLGAACADDDDSDPSTSSSRETPATLTTDVTTSTETTAAPSTPSTAETTASSSETDPTAPAERLVVEVIETFPHDDTSFTQGLELDDDGTLVESAGLYGQSEVRRVELATGEVLDASPVDPALFAEGLTQVDDRLIQITWQEQTALVYEANTLDLTGSFSYEGEGWGLCLLDDQLIMSNGSDRLTFRDPTSFEPTGEVAVTLEGQPVVNLNELECVDGAVWANVWQTDTIVRIDPASGTVTATVDASGLIDRAEFPTIDVLNGIAYDAGSDTFLITGKFWPTLFRVRFVPV